MPDFLHNRDDFADLLRIVAGEEGIDPALVEKDYWIMHCLHGLQLFGLSFELKGGTSLSKGFGLIHRFSEDIDIRIEPPKEMMPEGMDVKTGRKHDKPAHRESRKKFYDWLAGTIQIDGIVGVVRDTDFDTPSYFSGGIRLHYQSAIEKIEGLKEGVLLEAGFDDVTPNVPVTISSWAYDHAAGTVEVTDNRAQGVKCYHPGYTLVEKLQTISTKFRRQQEGGGMPVNFMRHYYDVYCLLQDQSGRVSEFIGTPEYTTHKTKRFPRADNPVISENEAFLLSDPDTMAAYRKAYEATRALYYREQPGFDEILAVIAENAGRL